jgi:hypothetical protein
MKIFFVLVIGVENAFYHMTLSGKQEEDMRFEVHRGSNVVVDDR